MKFIESICLRDGLYQNLALHQQRMDRVFEKYMPSTESHDLNQILPKLSLDGTYKVRLVYDMDSEDIEYNIEFAEYQPRKVASLEVMSSQPFDYSLKYENRSPINELVNQSEADDIIIAIDDRVTDGSYFNLVFWDGKNWLTPDSCLLDGVRRQQLLQEGRIKEAAIKVNELENFEKVSLINAMLDLDQLTLPIDAIVFPKNVD